MELHPADWELEGSGLTEEEEAQVEAIETEQRTEAQIDAFKIHLARARKEVDHYTAALAELGCTEPTNPCDGECCKRTSPVSSSFFDSGTPVVEEQVVVEEPNVEEPVIEEGATTSSSLETPVEDEKAEEPADEPKEEVQKVAEDKPARKPRATKVDKAAKKD